MTLYLKTGTTGSVLRVADDDGQNVRAFAGPATLGAIGETRALSGKLIFEGFGSGVSGSPSNAERLYVSTNGTATGTTVLADLYAQSGRLFTTFVGEAANRIFFTVAAGSVAELWSTDGTAAGTTKAGVLTGGVSTFTQAYDFTVFQGRIYWTQVVNASTTNRRELWSSDGTGVTQVYAPSVGGVETSSALTNTQTMKVVDGTLFFTARDANSGNVNVELYATDGTTANTRLVKDIASGSGSSSPNNMAVLGGRLVFAAQTDAAAREVWISDGTAAGTTLLKDIQPGAGSSEPNSFVSAGGKVFFIANRGPYSFSSAAEATGAELWVTDGTPAGTVMVKNIGPDTFSGYFVGVDAQITGLQALGSRVVFRAADAAGGELWSSDGTEAGTVRLTDSLAGSGTGVQGVAANGRETDALVISAGKAFFTAYTPGGQELWVSDGTLAGTQLIKEINVQGGADPLVLTAVKGGVAFTAQTFATGREAWFSDGTAAGTRQVTETGGTTLPEVDDPTPLKLGSNYVFAVTHDGLGRELWALDGSSKGASLIADIGEGSLSGLSYSWKPQPLGQDNLSALLGDRLFFRGASYGAGQELWVTDGTSAGTYMVKDIEPGATGSAPLYFAAMGGKMYFNATTSAQGSELWVSDGTAAGTYLVADVSPQTTYGNQGSFLDRLTTVGNQLFFRASSLLPNGNSNGGFELYVSDGTAGGTHLVKDIRPGNSGSSPEQMTAFGSKLFFVANESNAVGAEPWISDGTESGTFRLLDINSGSQGSSVDNINVVGNKLFFRAAGAAGQELWVTDGTTVGTAQVKDLYPGVTGSSPTGFFSFGGRLFFNANDGAGGGFFTTDGTTAGTYKLSLQPAFNATPLNGKLLFSKTVAGTGTEIWVGDGDLSNAVLLGDYSASTSATGYGTEILGVQNGRLLFQATSTGAQADYRYYTTDGTSAGTTAHGLVSASTTANAIFDTLNDPAEVATSVFPGLGGPQIFARGATGVFTRLTDLSEAAGTVVSGFVSVPSGGPATLSGTAPATVSDHGTVSPFASAVVTDGSPAGAVITVTVNPFYVGAGEFTPASLTASGFAGSADGTATFQGTAAAAQAGLRTLVFAPSIYAARGGASVEQTLSVILASSGGSSTNSTTLLTIIGTNDAPTAPDLPTLNDSGVSNSDNLTNAAPPHFKGRADVGATVELRDGATVVATLTADATGSYDFTPTLCEGAHTLTASAPGGASAALTVTIDRTAPVNAGAGATFSHGSEFTLTNAMLSATDAYGTASQLRYTLNAYSQRGTLYVKDTSFSGYTQLFTGATFTQAQLDAGDILYRNSGVYIGADTPDLTLRDPAGNARAAGLVLTGTNAQCVAVDDVIVVQGTNVVSTTTRATGVIANDTDADPFDLASGLSVLGVKTGGPTGTFTGTGTAIQGTYGTLSVQNNGTYFYTPNSSVGQLTSQQSDVFYYKLTDVFSTSTASLTFKVGPQGTAPTVNGVPGVQNVQDKAGEVAAFAAVTIGETNAQPSQITVTVTPLTNAVFYGYFTHLGGGTVNEYNRVWTFTGTAAQVTAALQALTFAVNNNQFEPGSTYDAPFEVKAQNAFGTTTGAQAVVLHIASVNDAPTTADDVNAVPQRLSIPGDVRANDGDVDATDVISVKTVAAGASPPVIVAGSGQTDIVGGWGVLHMSFDGKYTYDATSEGVAVGASVSDTFTIVVKDRFGGEATEQLVITVNGSPTGNTGNNSIVGSAGDDVLSGLAGLDVISGGFGADVIYGNQDNDILYGNQDNDVLYAGQGDDVAYGGQGDDIAYGNLGDDLLLGNLGNDTLNGGAGDDRMDGGDGIDTASYLDAPSAVTVSLLASGASQATGGAGSDTLISIENLVGSAFNDTLTGDYGANVLSGGFGADSLSGGYGADVLYGNQDDDALYGNQDADVLYGGQGNDALFGGAGDDVLYGNLGDDLLQGGAGVDLMWGGPGADIFRFTSPPDSVGPAGGVFDRVLDFEPGVDKLDLRGVRAGAGSYSFQIDDGPDGTVVTVPLDPYGYGFRVILTGAHGMTANDIFWT